MGHSISPKIKQSHLNRDYVRYTCVHMTRYMYMPKMLLLLCYVQVQQFHLFLHVRVLLQCNYEMFFIYMYCTCATEMDNLVEIFSV